MQAPLPLNEGERLFILRSLNLLDTPIDERFDRITRILCNALDVPVSAISLVDEARQWFKSAQGMPQRQTLRSESFCAYAILSDDIMVVEDAMLDNRFAENPLVKAGPKIRFYAGVPISIRNTFHIGTLCAMDTAPRKLSEAQKDLIRDLCKMVESEIAASQMCESHFELLKEMEQARQAR